MDPVVRALLQCHDSSLPCPSSLRTLVGVVSTLGPLLTSPLSSCIVGVPLGSLSPSLLSPEALLLLELLVACVRSGSPQLCPAQPGAVVQLLTQLANAHPAQQVQPHPFIRSASTAGTTTPFHT